MDTSDKKLNREQLQAIRHKTGPLLIIAGAGTGKTTVITERVKYLIEKKLAKPQEILALTFTEKAAREMETRIDIALPYGFTQMWVLTFHSFCERVLRQNALEIGLDPGFKLMTEGESIQLVRKNLFKFDVDYFRPLGNPNKFISGMLQHFSRLQDEDVSPIDYVQWVKKSKKKNETDEDKMENKKWKELSSAYKTYEEIKIKEGMMDFGDLITKTLKLMRERSNILKEYQNQFKYILIDEFQDTNYAQNQLAILLAGKQKNITVVGDDDQSVYRFRGAAVSNIVAFRKSFPKTKVVVLTQNYRSTQEILDRAYELIQYNNPDRLEVVEKIDKKLKSVRKKKGEKIEFIYMDRLENEADEVTAEISKLVGKGKYNYGDVAILVRANNHAEAFTRSFTRNGIPHQFLGPARLFHQSEIIDLISYLKVLYDFSDSPSFYRVLSMDIFDVPAWDIAVLGNFARKNNISLFEAVAQSKNEKLIKITELVKKQMDLMKSQTAGEILYAFFQESKLLEQLAGSESDEDIKKANNISKFFEKLKSYEVNHTDASVSAVVEWIDLLSELGESPLAADSDWSEVNAVNILTVHSSKGLEFPVVFLVNLVAQRFPTIERREQIPIPDELIKEVLPSGDYHLQEERRLFYVGMTRAKDLLYFTAAKYYGEGKREKKVSPFVGESLGESYKVEKQSKRVNKKVAIDYSKKKVSVSHVKAEKLKIDYISYSQIETFKVCPLHYKLRYILKIPTPVSPSQSFGISMHNALKDFYESVKMGGKPSKKLLSKVLNKNWIKEGYTSKAHEEKMMERGEKFLNEFLEKEFEPNELPILMEEPFSISLAKDLRIGGKIDRVDELPEGRIEIIDYKTGANVPTQKEVDKDLQLTFYALAATTLKERPFNKKPEDVKLSLYYFEAQTKISTVRTRSQLEKAKEEILKVREEIEKSDFKCSGGFLCKNCEYKSLCNSEDA